VDEERFWQLIDAAREVSAMASGQAAWLEKQLRHEGPEGTQPGALIRDFDQCFWVQMQKAFRWDLWGVASLVHGEGTQEVFLAFRAWLISLGRERFEAALADPDSLASEVWPAATGLPLCYVGRNAWAGLFEGQLPTPTLDLFVEPRGEPIKESDLAVRFPKVAAAMSR
tara:strand:+ start:1645 stop:2151 length:507 start_codon:yes stop_codon:yes gene_type:complete